MELGRLFYSLALEGMDEFQDDVNSTQNNTEHSSNKIVESFKKIGAAIVTYLSVQKIIEFGKAVVDAAATVSAETSAFEQIMGDYSDKAQAKMKEVADATGVVDTRLTTYMTSMTAKFKGLGYDIDDATSLAADGLTLASDAAAFWDKSLDESMSHLNSFINGSYEGGEAIGLFANDTQMAQYAIRTGVIKTTAEWSKLDEATKQATRLEYAKLMYEQSGATGQAAKEAEQYANVQANLTEKWRQFKAQVGEPILQNIVLPAMQKLSDLVDKASIAFEELKVKVKEVTEWYQKNKTWVDLLVIAVGSIVVGMTAYQTVMALVTAKAKLAAAAQALMNSAMLASPITWIVAGITLVVAAFIYLWNNCEGFRKFWINLWENVKSAWNSFKTTIGNGIDWVSNKFKSLLSTAKNIWNTLKNLFSGQITLPKIKMPHFSITPSGWKVGDLLKGSIPKLGISWYAKGGILNEPTIFGYNPASGRVKVGGEAGPEAVAPIDTLLGYVRTAVSDQNSELLYAIDRLSSMLAEYLPTIANKNSQLVLDTGVMVGQTAPLMNAELGKIHVMSRRGS